MTNTDFLKQKKEEFKRDIEPLSAPFQTHLFVCDDDGAPAKINGRYLLDKDRVWSFIEQAIKEAKLEEIEWLNQINHTSSVNASELVKKNFVMDKDEYEIHTHLFRLWPDGSRSIATIENVTDFITSTQAATEAQTIQRIRNFNFGELGEQMEKYIE